MMNLIKATDNDCFAASLAMVLGEPLDVIKDFTHPEPAVYPFPPPWENCPLIPDMNVIADWLLHTSDIAVTPFDYAPYCCPDPNLICPSVPVYEDDAHLMFERQLDYGPGIIECWYKDKGHMVAWDGQFVYDPHGHIFNFAGMENFGLTPVRFWLFSKVSG